MIIKESEKVGLKETVVSDLKKEIIAFANCQGGNLYIGVKDDGTIIGLDNPFNNVYTL
ncbi:ATP-binding protein [Eubacterium sp. AF05-24]|uniref:AlbA family DNA-binding domain-containing protein n=1 Tax=Eubacterium sp. AF05-24 TaxID=2996995 RepID=UPI002FDB6D92